jgi:hypothetical protein
MNKPIRLYLDEDSISRALIRALHARNVDVITAQEAGLLGTPDSEQLAFAVANDCTLFTFNVRDFAQLHKIYLAEGKHHTGIIVSDQVQVGVLLRRLLKLLNAKSADEMRDWLEFLSNWQ